MKTLILSCNTGEGHNSCAKAIQQYYTERGEECDIADCLGLFSPMISNMISKLHVRVYRYAPKLFDKSYSLLEDHPRLANDRSLLYRLIALGAKKLVDFIRSGGYDSVICTHVISSSMLTYAMKREELNLLSTGLLITDYTCHPFASDSGLDVCFMPDASLEDVFANQGIRRETLTASGIPVRRAFYTRTAKSEAKRQCGIPASCRHLLVMCGSMGCGPIRSLARNVADQVGDNVYMTVVCGTNEHLRKKLAKKYKNRPNIRVLGFTDEVSLLMDSADLYLTKPGGLSVTEAAIKRLPMVFINAVAGCEDANLAFFTSRGGAISGNDSRALARECVGLLNDPERLALMSEKLDEIGIVDASPIIYARMHAFAPEPASV